MRFLKTKVAMVGRDEITIEPMTTASDQQIQFELVGCPLMLRAFSLWRTQQKDSDPLNWSLPAEVDHGSLLIKEAILRFRGQWVPPYGDEEICHCRRVRTSQVHDAILQGAHTIEAIQKMTSAGTSCGSCCSDLQSLASYIVKNK